MKKTLITSVLFLLSIISFSQSYYQDTIVLNMDSIEANFDRAYMNYLDTSKTVVCYPMILNSELHSNYINYLNTTKRRIKMKYDGLDSVSYCQLNYLKNQIFISHSQPDEKFSSINERFRFFYKNFPKYGGEVVCLNHKRQTEKEVAIEVLNHFLSSPKHRAILDDYKSIYFNFKFAINKGGYVLCVGTFSSRPLTYKN